MAQNCKPLEQSTFYSGSPTNRPCPNLPSPSPFLSGPETLQCWRWFWASFPFSTTTPPPVAPRARRRRCCCWWCSTPGIAVGSCSRLPTLPQSSALQPKIAKRRGHGMWDARFQRTFCSYYRYGTWKVCVCLFPTGNGKWVGRGDLYLVTFYVLPMTWGPPGRTSERTVYRSSDLVLWHLRGFCFAPLRRMPSRKLRTHRNQWTPSRRGTSYRDRPCCSRHRRGRA